MMSPASHRLARLPRWLSRWLGYRDIPPARLVRYETCFWSFVAAFCGIALIQAVFGQAGYFIRRGVPPIIASYVRTSILVHIDGLESNCQGRKCCSHIRCNRNTASTTPRSSRRTFFGRTDWSLHNKVIRPFTYGKCISGPAVAL